MKKHLLAFSLMLHSTCIGNAEVMPIAPVVCKTESINKETWIVVFVHGIISIKPYLTFPNIVRLLRDRIAHTAYERAIELTRCDPFFYQHHAMQKAGLHKISFDVAKSGAASTAYADLFETMYGFCNKNNTTHYYTFGWSGLLSPRMRHVEARLFYDQLLQVCEGFWQQDVRPKIGLVCYSHGGNIALKLGEVYHLESYPPEKKLIVDQLVLYGLPVLPETDYLINSPLFKRVYHIFSFGDRVQPLDFFSRHRITSNRMFRTRSDFTVPNKLVQIELRIRRPIEGKEYIVQPHNNLENILSNRRLMRNADPGHAEYWSFGWSLNNYRANFPLNPCPVAVLTPYIIHQTESLSPNSPHVVMELHPHYEHLLWYDIAQQTRSVHPFLTKQQQNTLKNVAEQYRPIDYLHEHYNTRVLEAKERARQEWFEKRTIRGFRKFRHCKTCPPIPSTVPVSV